MYIYIYKIILKDKNIEEGCGTDYQLNFSITTGKTPKLTDIQQ